MKTKYIIDDLEIYDIENIFDVNAYNDYYRYNLNNTIYLNYEEHDLSRFTTNCREFWTTISYQLYGTTRLAWVLMKVNDVKSDNIFKPIEPGQQILYPSMDQVKEIIDFIIS